MGERNINKPKIPVVAYIRVSTEEQNPESQFVEIKRFCEENGYKIVETFWEKGVSGSIPPLEREKFLEALKYCVNNNIGIIIVLEMSRFYRPEDPVAFFEEMKKIMTEYGVVIRFVKEPQIEDPFLRRLWEFLKAWYSGYERFQIRMRTKLGMQRLKQEGKLYTRPDLAWYYASWLLNKPFEELKKDDVERIAQQLCKIIENYIIRGYKKEKIPEALANGELRLMYERFPQAPKSWKSFKRFLRKYCKKSNDK